MLFTNLQTIAIHKLTLTLTLTLEPIDMIIQGNIQGDAVTSVLMSSSSK